MRAQTILFLSVDGVKEKLDCRPYRGGGEGQSQETTRGCKPRRFKPVEYLDHTSCSLFMPSALAGDSLRHTSCSGSYCEGSGINGRNLSSRGHLEPLSAGIVPVFGCIG